MMFGCLHIHNVWIKDITTITLQTSQNLRLILQKSYFEDKGNTTPIRLVLTQQNYRLGMIDITRL